MQAGQGRAIVGSLGGGQLLLDLAQAQIPIENVVYGYSLECIDFLTHVSYTPISRQLAVTGIGHELAAQQGEQGGFAGAVGTDEAGFLTGVQGQLGVF